ncbi:TetR/AcrR family transcriptional regulator [Variovorax sp. W2I14]|uniref:TetR/AcrR family transcriptional regulator n=1 Tax=Variovorax sp. W2I14 TaxID=3042290 RepID=UPI003D25A225
MTRKAITRPRKHATQERSKVTVDALVEATARILVKEGFDKASTNRIAEAAGVSVGSLYQYFPSKEALVAAVIERHNAEIAQIVRGAMAEVASQPVAKAVRRLVAVAIEAHRLDPRLHRVLAEQIPHTGRFENAVGLIRETHAFFAGYLEAHREELRVTDLELAAFMCVTAIEALAHTAVLHRTDMLSDKALKKLTDETTRLVVGYLQ